MLDLMLDVALRKHMENRTMFTLSIKVKNVRARLVKL